MNKERGLWVGLPVPELPESNIITPYIPADAHVTLLHLGRTASQEKVSRVHTAILSRSQLPAIKLAEITGVGWFWRNYGTSVLVALVNSAQLLDLRTAICTVLDEWDINYDRKFGFIPHITLDKHKPITTAILGNNFGVNQSPRFPLAKLELVWGDTKMALT